jgi:hypothetical protein
MPKSPSLGRLECSSYSGRARDAHCGRKMSQRKLLGAHATQHSPSSSTMRLLSWPPVSSGHQAQGLRQLAGQSWTNRAVDMSMECDSPSTCTLNGTRRSPRVPHRSPSRGGYLQAIHGQSPRAKEKCMVICVRTGCSMVHFDLVWTNIVRSPKSSMVFSMQGVARLPSPPPACISLMIPHFPRQNHSTMLSFERGNLCLLCAGGFLMDFSCLVRDAVMCAFDARRPGLPSREAGRGAQATNHKESHTLLTRHVKYHFEQISPFHGVNAAWQLWTYLQQ